MLLFSRARNCPFDLTQPLSWTAPRLSVASGKQTLFSAFAQRTPQDPSPWSALPVVVCSSASVGRGKPGLSRAGPRAMGRGIPEGACDRGYAAKARCRQGTAADRPLGRPLPTDDDEPPGECGWVALPWSADPRGAPLWSPKAFRCNGQRTQNRPASEAQQRPERAVQLSTGRAASCPGGGQLQGDFLSRAQILIAAVASPGRARANSDSPVSYVTNSGYGSPWRNASGARSPARAKA